MIILMSNVEDLKLRKRKQKEKGQIDFQRTQGRCGLAGEKMNLVS